MFSIRWACSIEEITKWRQATTNRCTCTRCSRTASTRSRINNQVGVVTLRYLPHPGRVFIIFFFPPDQFFIAVVASPPTSDRPCPPYAVLAIPARLRRFPTLFPYPVPDASFRITTTVVPGRTCPSNACERQICCDAIPSKSVPFRVRGLVLIATCFRIDFLL